MLFFAGIIWMLQAWRADMAITAVDRKWGMAMDYYIRNEDESLPPADRFNVGQKYFFWVMLWGGVLLLISGVVLWFPERIPWSLRGIRYAAILLHVSAALITIGAFIIHVYMGTAMVRGGFTSIIRGEVSPAWARMHHRLWYERVAAADRGR
jgi:formate dehydrogenase subunit gamma